MAWFRKKPDPISDRERALSDEIAALEAQIKQLDNHLHRDQSHPRLRSTAVPHGATISHSVPPPSLPPPPPPPPPPARDEPIFEELGQDLLQARHESTSTPDHYNELGVRKYDLPALIRRLRNHFRGPSTTNPKLVSYLAAGGIQGLRPLRYEMRVTRNRFIALAVVFFIILLGLIVVYVKGK
jgi:hypothetical protein